MIQCVNLDIGNFFTDHCSALIGQSNRQGEGREGEERGGEEGECRGTWLGVNTRLRLTAVASFIFFFSISLSLSLPVISFPFRWLEGKRTNGKAGPVTACGDDAFHLQRTDSVSGVRPDCLRPGKRTQAKKKVHRKMSLPLGGGKEATSQWGEKKKHSDNILELSFEVLIQHSLTLSL